MYMPGYRPIKACRAPVMLLSATFVPVFSRLQQKWGVSATRVVLILCTFAIGGSLCSWAGKQLMSFSGMEKGFWWWVLYLVLVTLLWPMCVMLISVFFGQFTFFKNYLGRMARRMGFGKKQPPATEQAKDK
jgi:hypothetical protein